MLAGKLAIPFSSLPRQLSRRHTFCSVQLQYNLLSQKCTITKILIAMSLKMVATWNFFCVFVCVWHRFWPSFIVPAQILFVWRAFKVQQFFRWCIFVKIWPKKLACLRDWKSFLRGIVLPPSNGHVPNHHLLLKRYLFFYFYILFYTKFQFLGRRLYMHRALTIKSDNCSR